MNEILRKRVRNAGLDFAYTQYKKGHENYNTLYEGFFKGAEYALSHQLIDVNEALPELNEEVLVVFPDNKAGIATRKKIEGKSGLKIHWVNGCYTYPDSWVCFWMPIKSILKGVNHESK